MVNFSKLMEGFGLLVILTAVKESYEMLFYILHLLPF